MKKLFAMVAAGALLATALQAGGPVVIEDQTVVEEKPATSAGWLVPALLIAVIGLVIVTGDDSGGNTW